MRKEIAEKDLQKAFYSATDLAHVSQGHGLNKTRYSYNVSLCIYMKRADFTKITILYIEVRTCHDFVTKRLCHADGSKCPRLIDYTN
jgi:hypothetical protein